MANGGGGGSGGASPVAPIGDVVDLTGTTAAGNAVVFDAVQARGLIGIGTIINTGGVNDLIVVETVTDKFGNTVTVERVLTAGNPYMLDPQTNFGDLITPAYPPYTEYKVQVRDGSLGSHTTYSVHYIDVNPT